MTNAFLRNLRFLKTESSRYMFIYGAQKNIFIWNHFMLIEL